MGSPSPVSHVAHFRIEHSHTLPRIWIGLCRTGTAPAMPLHVRLACRKPWRFGRRGSPKATTHEANHACPLTFQRSASRPRGTVVHDPGAGVQTDNGAERQSPSARARYPALLASQRDRWINPRRAHSRDTAGDDGDDHERGDRKK
jgi:hypothetical protein